jgi:anti-sigma B factor antagonist
MMAEPPFTVTLDRVGDVPVIRAVGELDLGTAAAIRQAFASVIAAEAPSLLIFDLREVTFMDGGGLGILVGARNRLHRCQGEVVVITEQPTVLLVLKLSGADRVLLVYPNEEAFRRSVEAGKSRCDVTHPTRGPACPPLP